MKRAKRTATRRLAKAKPERDKLPLIEHLKELRRRLVYVAVCIAVGSGVAYGLEHQLVDVLLRPSHGQNFIYTSPLGGMNFLFTVCLDLGLVVSTPVIIYQLLAFIRPLMRDTTRKFLLLASGITGLLAVCGLLFGYFLGLPSALHFLLHQFTTIQVKPLITIQSYMQFVALYLFGSALMFQLPLIMLFINRIKPIKPSKLFKYERHLIVGAFITAFIMNPTPNIVDQLLVVVPIIISYQVGILAVWIAHKRGRPSTLQVLRDQDAQRRAERLARELRPLTLPAPEMTASSAAPDVAPVEEPLLAPAAPAAGRPNQYAASFSEADRGSYVSVRSTAD